MAHGIEVTATSDLKSATSQSSEFPQQVLYSHSWSFALRMTQHDNDNTNAFCCDSPPWMSLLNPQEE